MFVIDGIEYDGVNCSVSGLTESISFVKGESDRTLLNGDRWTNTIGFRRSHSITLTRDPSLANEAWEALWNKLLEIANVHTFAFPNGLNGTVNYSAEVKDLSRDLLYIQENQNGTTTNIWGDYTLSVEGIECINNPNA